MMAWERACAVWDHSVFSKNRDRLLEGDIAAKFLNAVLEQPRVRHVSRRPRRMRIKRRRDACGVLSLAMGKIGWRRRGAGGDPR